MLREPVSIAVVYRPPALTAAQYKASWTAGPPVAPPLGLIFHAGVGEGDDFMTMTVWESLDRYNAFAPVFQQAMAEIGVVLGKPQILPVHKVFAPPSGA